MAKTRKAVRKGSRKARKATGKKTRKMTPWLQKVMKVYREMKAKDPSVRLGDAMKAAKRM
jgi:hypothetical protein